MPSNAMSISQHIALMQTIMEQHGDLDVVLAFSVDAKLVALDGRNTNVAIEFPWQKLSEPVVVLGMWQNEVGGLTSSPGQIYQATHTPDEWNNSRDAAPFAPPAIGNETYQPILLDVWKRYGGQDVGYRDANGRWFVWEDDSRPHYVEIVPAGVLRWKMRA